MFLEERARRLALAQCLTQNEAILAADKDDENQQEQCAQHLQEQGRASTEADVAFQLRLKVVLRIKALIAEFRSYNVFRGNLAVIQCLLFLLEYTPAQCCDAQMQPDWKKIRMLFSEELFQKLMDYDPRRQQLRGKKQKYATIDALQGLIKDLEVEEIREKNYPLSVLFEYIQAAIALKIQARDERVAEKQRAKEQKEEEEEEERKRKEEEEEEESRKKAEEEEQGQTDDSEKNEDETNDGELSNESLQETELNDTEST